MSGRPLALLDLPDPANPVNLVEQARRDGLLPLIARGLRRTEGAAWIESLRCEADAVAGQQAALEHFQRLELVRLLDGLAAAGVRPLLHANLLDVQCNGRRIDEVQALVTEYRAATDVRLDGLDRRTHFKVTGTGTGPIPPNADDIKLSPDGQRAFVSLQGKHYMVNVPKAGKETVAISITANGPSSVPIKKMSPEGGDYLNWSNDGKSVTWAWGAKFYRQDVSADKPDVTDVIVEAPRARPKGTVVLSGARIVTMKADEVIERGETEAA